MDRKQINIFCFINALSSLSLGTGIYCFFRRNTYFHVFLKNIGIALIYIPAPDTFPFNILKYYLPDFLWLYSMLFCLFSVFKPTDKKAYIMAILSFGLGFVLELLQQKNIISGTADIADIFVYFCAALAGCMIYKKITRKERKPTQ